MHVHGAQDIRLSIAHSLKADCIGCMRMIQDTEARTIKAPLQMDGFGFGPAAHAAPPSSWEQVADTVLAHYPVMLVSDRMAESAVMLAVRFNWTLWDMAALRTHDSHRAGGMSRWDGKLVVPVDKATLSPQLRASLTRVVAPDRPLYAKASARLDAFLARLPPAHLTHVLDTYDLMQAALGGLCHALPPDLDPADPGLDRRWADAKRFCAWLEMPDSEADQAPISDGAKGKPSAGYAVPVPLPGIDPEHWL